jgi:hypothetical protein
VRDRLFTDDMAGVLYYSSLAYVCVFSAAGGCRVCPLPACLSLDVHAIGSGSFAAVGRRECS